MRFFSNDADYFFIAEVLKEGDDTSFGEIKVRNV